MARNFVACREKVLNRGKPPVAFLDQLVDWGKSAPNEIFSPNTNTDIYSFVKGELGPWANDLERRAAMLEVLRVLGGFESSWDWNAGRDTTNPGSNTACTEEAGILQVSGNSMNFDSSLKDLVRNVAGTTDCDTFRATTKANHPFALEYCARLLRFTVNHHGPVKRREINPELRTGCDGGTAAASSRNREQRRRRSDGVPSDLAERLEHHRRRDRHFGDQLGAERASASFTAFITRPARRRCRPRPRPWRRAPNPPSASPRGRLRCRASRPPSAPDSPPCCR